MEDVQRILSKVVGQEISGEELELVTGGLKGADCPDLGGQWTYLDATQRVCDE
jgi:hypothetical protein